MINSWKSSYEHRARFNRQKNAELFDCARTITPKALVRERGSWFGSISGLLNHILITDIHWLDRFRPLDPSAGPLTDGRLDSFSLAWEPLGDDIEMLTKARTTLDAIFCDWFSHFPEAKYGIEFDYEDSAGGINRITAAGAFDFVLMHQNYHRGQLSQILDEIGLPHSFADNGDFEKV